MKVTRVIAAAICTVAAVALSPGAALADDGLDISDPSVGTTFGLEADPRPADKPPHCRTMTRPETSSAQTETSRICIYYVEGYQYAYVDWRSPYWSNYSVSFDATVYLQRCGSSNPSSCTTTIAANSDYFLTPGGSGYLRTSEKPEPAGVYHRACASLTVGTGWKYVARCTTPVL